MLRHAAQEFLWGNSEDTEWWIHCAAGVLPGKFHGLLAVPLCPTAYLYNESIGTDLPVYG